MLNTSIDSSRTILCQSQLPQQEYWLSFRERRTGHYVSEYTAYLHQRFGDFNHLRSLGVGNFEHVGEGAGLPFGGEGVILGISALN